MDPQALSEHIPRLRRYARTLTGDRWAADDLVQDTLERACAKWRLWTVGSDLRAWLFALMHNLRVSQLRRNGLELVSASSGSPEAQQAFLDAAGPAAGDDTALDLQRCLLRLPAEQREVLLLVSLEDLSYEQVARITQVPVGTVMSRLSRARARLRELLDAPPGPASSRTTPADAPRHPAPQAPAKVAPLRPVR